VECIKLTSEKWASENPEKRSEIHKAWRTANPEQDRENGRRWRTENPERCVQLKAAYRAANQERVLAAERRHREANAERIRQNYKRWIAANAERARRVAAEWKKANAEHVRALKAAYKARRRGADGTFSRQDVKYLFVAQRGRCAYCKAQLKKAYHIDHIVPLSKGGANFRRNIQLTCPPCNMRKHDKLPEDFAQELGLLL
jgi:5-methylcytosine-specific restriction endonuclease McrA